MHLACVSSLHASHRSMAVLVPTPASSTNPGDAFTCDLVILHCGMGNSRLFCCRETCPLQEEESSAFFLRHAFTPDPPVSWCPAGTDLPKGRLHPDTACKEGDFSTGDELPRPFSWRKGKYLHKVCTVLLICYVKNRKQLKGCAVLGELRWRWTGGFRTMFLW